jgi:hypothetical protein
MLSSISIDPNSLVSFSKLKHSLILMRSTVKTTDFTQQSQSTMLSLLCYVRGDDYNNAFIVEVDKTKTISHLRKIIKEEYKSKFDGIDAVSLSLWRTSVQYSENLKEDVDALDLGQRLEPVEILSDIPWSLGKKRVVHVIIDRSQKSGELRLPMSLLSILNRQQPRVTSIRRPFTLTLCQSV